MLHKTHNRRIWSGSGSLLQKLGSKDILTSLLRTAGRCLFVRNPKLVQTNYRWFPNFGLELGEDFHLPIHCIGQTVLHRTKVNQGEILYPVLIMGLFWTGAGWEYSALLPEQHPEFVHENCEIRWLDEWEIESLEAI